MFNSLAAKLRVYRFFDDFVIIYPLYTLMFASSGLSVNQISMLLAAWSLTAFILEVPSGVLADKYDRRNILILAQSFRILGFLLWYIFPTFWGFLFGFVLWGIKSAFTSGTLEAYLYDGLKAEGKERNYSKILGSLKGLSFIAILLSSGLASGLFYLGYQAILLLSITSLAISIFALGSAKSRKIAQSTEEAKYFALLSEGIGNVFKNSKLLILVLISSVLIGAMAIDEYFALYVEEVNISLSLVGYLFALYSLLQTFASLIAHRFESQKFLLPILAIFSLLIFAIGFAKGYVGVILFMVLAFISSIGQVISNTAIQNATKEQVRATVGSVTAFFAEIIAFGVYLVFLILPSGEIRQGLVIFGGLIICMSLLIMASVLLKKETRLFSV